MSGPRDRLLTPAEADAVLDVLDLGWADRDAMNGVQSEVLGLTGRRLEAARRATAKIQARAEKLKRRVKREDPVVADPPVTHSMDSEHGI